jgi:hypothetical protein
MFPEGSSEAPQRATFVADIKHTPRQLALFVGNLAPFSGAAAMAHRLVLPHRRSLRTANGLTHIIPHLN